MNEASPQAPDVDPQITSIRNQAGDFLDSAVAMRRRLHEWPELGNDLPITLDEAVRGGKVYGFNDSSVSAAEFTSAPNDYMLLYY